MSTMKIGSNWLESGDDDGKFIEKSVGRGLGSIIAGAPLVQKLAALHDTIAVCKNSHETALAKVESLKKCRCGAPWAVVKGEKLEEDESTPTYERAVKSDQIPTGGSLDGQPILTSKSRVRRPWTGTR